MHDELTDEAQALNRYLHEQIPMAAAMQLRVRALDARSLSLCAPWAPNRNPHQTIFGGSLASLAVACGWSLLHTALSREGLAADVVVQHFDADFLAPARDEFCATAELGADWPGFLATLAARHRARLRVPVTVHSGAREVLRAHARYAARLATDDHD